MPKHTSPLNDWLNYLECIHEKSIDLGLDRVSHVAKNLKLLRPASFVITVGGTNGKGTTCQLIEAILLESGKRVGVYSSPHFLCYTERVRIQGKKLPESKHSKAMAMIELGRGTTSLTYFEFGTLAALQLFKKEAIDVLILEVGLGGRLDATNIIDPDIAVITSIALDHTDWLGFDLDSIAREKAGIFRYGKPAVIGEFNPPSALHDVAKDVGAIPYTINHDWWWRKEDQTWRWWNNIQELLGLPFPKVPLENAATALAVIAHLPFKVTDIAIRQGLQKAVLPGRFQQINRSPLIILDVAHNPHAASYLANHLPTLSKPGKIRAVVGMLSNKDIAGVFFYLQKKVDFWYCSSLDVPHSASAIHLASYLDRRAKKFSNIVHAYSQALKDSIPEDCILVFGSFYAVSPIMRLLKKSHSLPI